MNEKNQNQNHLDNSKKNETNNEWVFVAIRKELVAKRTKEYVLIKLPYGYSAIINAKFIRKKESDTHIFASMPYNYKINVRQTQFSTDNKKWNVVDEKTKYPRQLSWDLHVLEEQLSRGQELKSILEYQDLNVKTDEPVPSDALPF